MFNRKECLFSLHYEEIPKEMDSKTGKFKCWWKTQKPKNHYLELPAEMQDFTRGGYD